VAFDPAQSVLVHGDAHQLHLLRASGTATGFKFIDPDGLVGERAFDLAIPMRDWSNVIPDGDLLQLGRDGCRLLADCGNVDEQAIWEWGLVQCVSNGLLLQQIGLDKPTSVQFAMADAWTMRGAVIGWQEGHRGRDWRPAVRAHRS
jgi:streptomycin 6-kinase